MAEVQTQQKQGSSEDSEITSADFEVFNDHTPELDELCDAASEVSYLWDQIGIGFGLKDGQLRAIQANTAGRPNQQQLCLTEVFTSWRNGRTSRYTWETFAAVLLRPRLAKDTKDLVRRLHKQLSEKYPNIR